MSNSDLRAFLDDVMLRYDPGVDLSDGSRARQMVVDPVLARVGIDPVDEDILTFILTRIRQAHPELALTGVDELTDMVVDPMRVLLEPIVREIKLLRLRGSIANVESLSDDEVDALLGNFFTGRSAGGYARGTLRIFYNSPQSVNISFLNYATSKSGYKFLPTTPQSITADQMFLNTEGSQYYFDVQYQGENRGDEYNVEVNEIIRIENLGGYASVRNIRKFREGVPREDSIAYAARVQSSQGDSTLNTQPGIVRRVTDAFPDVRRLFSVGFRDPEMQRDIVTGGGFSSFLPNDTFGPLRGSNGSSQDDGDDDFTSPILYDADGHFVSRLGAVGSASGWYITLIYAFEGDDIFQEVAVLSVIDDTRIVVDHEFPSIPDLVTNVKWILRKKELSISNIPGGIALPNGPDGSLIVAPDAVHIGGKIDLYIAGATDEASARIDSLGDETPYAAGVDARTDGAGASPDEVTLYDIDPDLILGVQPGMSLVLDEGSDVGSYRIRRIIDIAPQLVVQLDTELTATQVGLIWRVVDIIDVTLTNPKSPRIAGADMVLAAGSTTVLTSGGANFLDAGVQKGDTLEVLGGPTAGLYDIELVGPVSLEIFPAPILSQSAVAYEIYRRSQALDAPLVRVKTIEVLDAAGAPTGTKVPYKHPVLAESRAFQNESSSVLFQSTVLLGLISDRISGTVSGTLNLFFRDRDAIWGAANVSYTDTWVGASLATIAADLNSDLPEELFARVVDSRLYITGIRHITATGTLATALGWTPGYTNASLRAQNTRDNFLGLGVRDGDVIEVVTGPQAGTKTRVASVTDGGGYRFAQAALGPTAAHSATIFNPSVDVQARIGRPSVGSVRAYFLDPTTVEFPYATARFVTAGGLEYRPDPTNQRVLFPAPPTTKLPASGVTTGTTQLTDANADFVGLGVRTGDLLEILYIPIVGDAALSAPPTTLTLAGLTLRIRLGTGPWVTISFPTDQTRTEAIAYINTRLGEVVADLASGNFLRLQSDKAIEIDPASTAFTALLGSITQYNSDHPDLGKHVITEIAPGGDENALSCAGAVFNSATLLRYRILRYTQRSSTTEMALQLDVTGLYFVDVELISTAPGNQYNIAALLSLEPTGYYSEGYELFPENQVLTYSRAEELKARMSRSILLNGSPDSDEERLQLTGLNILVSYDRSQLVEDVQGFASANFTRVQNAETLVRHLLPHYVRLQWKYVAGASELENVRALERFLDEVEPGEQLEVDDLSGEIRRRGATSVYAEDAESPTGRTAPLLVIVYHGEDRRVRARVVRDFVDTVRAQRFIPEILSLTRVSTGGIR